MSKEFITFVWPYSYVQRLTELIIRQYYIIPLVSECTDELVRNCYSTVRVI